MRIKVIKGETDRIVLEDGALPAKIVLAMLKSREVAEEYAPRTVPEAGRCRTAKKGLKTASAA
jgi:hypothetical protein